MFFTIYTILLMVSGLMLTGMGVRLRNMGTGRRVLNILVGLRTDATPQEPRQTLFERRLSQRVAG